MVAATESGRDLLCAASWATPWICLSSTSTNANKPSRSTLLFAACQPLIILWKISVASERFCSKDSPAIALSTMATK